MLKSNKKSIRILLMLMMVAFTLTYFTANGDWVLLLIFLTATTVMTIMSIVMIVVGDKNERREAQKELRMHRLIYATVEGVTEIKKQGSDTYKVYTDTDIYMVEYGETASKIIHVGTYQTINMEATQ